MIDEPDLDSALARSLHLQGLVPLVTLRAMLERTRNERPTGGPSLARQLADRGLLPEATLEGVLKTLLTPTAPERPADPNPGTQLGSYLLDSKLGEGGMGIVHAARHQETGARYAVKSFTPTSPDELLRFKRETDAMAAVDGHPNVIRVHASGTEGGRAYVVMELAEGGDLQTRLRREPLPPREAAELVCRLARGVEHLHAQGVLHRDLKPGNVLFDAGGTPKLVDFGLAHVADQESLTRTGDILGTPSHMAPEQALGDKTAIGELTDVYGLGAILYHCLTGSAPAQGASVLAILNAVVLQVPPRPSSVNPAVDSALDALTLRALEKRPHDRPQGAAALRAELEAYLRGERLSTVGLRRPLIVSVLLLGVVSLALVLRGFTPEAPDVVPATDTASPRPTTSLLPNPAPRPTQVVPLAAGGAIGWPTWRRVHVGPEAKREGLHLAYFPPSKRVLMFGGRVPGKNASADLFSWSADRRRWTRNESIVIRPRSRTRFGMAYHAGRKSLLVAGGSRSPGESLSDIREWTGKGWGVGDTWPSWREVRQGHQIACDPDKNRAYVFGGRTRAGLTNTLWKSTGGPWTLVTPPGRLPPPREQFAMTFDTERGVLVLFGGLGVDAAGKPKVLSDLWEFDGKRWREPPLLGSRPVQRRGATLVDLGGAMLLLLGGSPSAVGGPALDQVWLRTPGAWKLLHFAARPSPRWGAGAAWDPSRKVLVLAGGENQSGLQDDTWELRELPVLFSLSERGLKWASGTVPYEPTSLLENFVRAAMADLTNNHSKCIGFCVAALAFPEAKGHPLRPMIHLQLGISYNELKQPQDAVKHLTKALDLVSDLHDARRERSEGYSDMGMMKEALVDVDDYLVHIPAPEVRILRARILHGLGRKTEAIRALRLLIAELQGEEDRKDPIVERAREKLRGMGG